MNTRSHFGLWRASILILAIGSCLHITSARVLSESTEAANIVGDVQFETSCAEEVQQAFNDAVATLHSFEFEEARGMFEAVAAKDPDCPMAAWGVAMTHYHPLWAPPRKEEVAAAKAALAKARSLEATPREKLYIEAIGAFFDDAENVGHRERAIRYEKAMAKVHEQHPDDKEAEIFYSLALISNVDYTDKTYAVQKRAGAMLEPLFVSMPNHPGIAHYIIHSYDYPPLAERAVDAAHRYLDIATSMPHALHMSGHIFTQLGMWEDSIDANARSAEAAREQGKRFGIAQGQMNEIHALDYLAYAYLQRGEDDKAKAIVDDINSRTNLNWKHGIVTFNAAAPPVRYAMERRDWKAAASLALLEDAEKAGGRYEAQNAIALRYWARSVGAARSGQIEQAEQNLAKVEKIAKKMTSAERVWARNTAEVFRLQATAWLALAKGESEQALEFMRAAVALEDQTDKSGLSPGRCLPGHEQLGDMLAELNRPQEALAEYEASMKQAPRRFNTYLGAARAAKDAGKPEVARGYYGKLVELASAQASRPELAEAKTARKVTSR